MKKIIILLIFLINVAYSLDTTSTKYFPLKVGNSWTYRVFTPSPPQYFYVKKTVISTFITNGHLYYTFNDSSHVRIDSLTGNLLNYLTNYGCPWLNNEQLEDSLSAKLNDSCDSHCRDDFFMHCTDTSNQVVFGQNRKHKKFYGGFFEHYETRQYARGIGLIYWESAYPFFIPYRTLLGCVIDGIVYGDTSITEIGKISLEVPLKFSLYQNYPNPFNPVTKIKFDVTVSPFEGGRGDVKLVIYNIQGKEIITLVNQQLTPGTYEADWNASEYPSGVYFYKLEFRQAGSSTGNYSETKRMVLIK